MKHYRRSKKGIRMVQARGLILAGIIRPADKHVLNVPDSKWCKEIVEPEGLSLQEQLEFSIGYATTKKGDDDAI